jgi:hypothetical protein
MSGTSICNGMDAERLISLRADALGMVRDSREGAELDAGGKLPGARLVWFCAILEGFGVDACIFELVGSCIGLVVGGVDC